MLANTDIAIMVSDEDGILQLFNIGAERMLGYQAHEVVNSVTPTHFSDAQELKLRAEALDTALGVSITSPFEALVFRARQGIEADGIEAQAIENSEELSFIRKDGMRVAAMVSITALQNAHNSIFGYQLIATSNFLRKDALERSRHFFALSQEMLAVASFDGYFKYLNVAW